MDFEPLVDRLINSVYMHPFFTEFVVIPIFLTWSVYFLTMGFRGLHVTEEPSKRLHWLNTAGNFFIAVYLGFFATFFSVIASKGTTTGVAVLCFFLPLAVGYVATLWIVRNLHKKTFKAFLYGF